MTDKQKNVPYRRFKEFENADAWEQRKLGKVFDTITDYVANGSFESLRKNVNSSDINGFAYLVRLQDASNNWQGPWLYTDQHGYEFLKKSRLQPDDIIMANVGSVGKFFLVPKLDKPMTLAPNAVLIKSSENDQGFLYQMMLTPEMQHKIFEKTTPGVQSKINKTDFKMVETRLPNIEEQEKIGQFFKRLDYTITLHQRKYDKLKKLKSAYLTEMFPAEGERKPKRRFSGFTDDWEQRKLGEVTSSYSGGTPSVGNPDYYDGSIPFIRSAEINNSKTELFISENGLASSSAKMVKPGDILYALYGATSGEVGISRINGAINQAVLALRPNEKYDSNFISQWLRSQKQNIIAKYLQGGQGNLSGSIVKNLNINFPSYKEQVVIGNFLNDLDNLITLHQQQLEKLKNLKQAYLNEMFV